MFGRFAQPPFRAGTIAGRFRPFERKSAPLENLEPRVKAFGEVLGFEPEFFYGPIEDVFREEECSMRHRRATPEGLKAKIRAHGTLIGMVITRLRSVLNFPEQDIPQIPATSN
jgi:hypothetical protein